MLRQTGQPQAKGKDELPPLKTWGHEIKEKNAWGCGDLLSRNRKVYATVFSEKWKARSLRE